MESSTAQQVPIADYEGEVPPKIPVTPPSRLMIMQPQSAASSSLGGDARLRIGVTPPLPVPFAFPMSYPVVVTQSYDLALRTKRVRTPRRSRSQGEGRPLRESGQSSSVAFQDMPSGEPLAAYGPVRQTSRGMMGETKENLAKRNAELLQELADMRDKQILWAERTEHMFALQKSRLEQVAEEYTSVARSCIFEDA